VTGSDTDGHWGLTPGSIDADRSAAPIVHRFAEGQVRDRAFGDKTAGIGLRPARQQGCIGGGGP
jgi:hypothetical protein